MKRFILLSLSIGLLSCNNPTCFDYENMYKADSCVVIVKEIPKDVYTSSFDYKGIHPFTKKQCSCKSKKNYRRWADYSPYISIGDTLIKRKGELVFSIHKKDTILHFTYQCGGKGRK
ncbi:hypothetical protein AM493_18610 [Flavobacterium akiainvivens]|uniref:Lipoprotein n=1 Tax=Flavobacterium akiainvivens TaxID=1202724 RepID=A0A0M8MBR2_9FLAO|nr:hypothetical protein [Flavobacterium akiainvivens]KOS07843.1 hypothetical protein AM493_18610 [Flavobacterium akiainvivens]SFQ27413.1 hypothetical protein SAMN05444144_102303 [Flavobacterium akiainvivens]